MTTTNRFRGQFRLLCDGSRFAVRGAALGPARQLTHHLDRLGLPWAEWKGAIGLGPWTSEQFAVWEAWAEPLRVDEPCTLFDCHPKHRRRSKRHAMNGMEHSIDYGPAWEIEVPYVDLATPFLPLIHVRVGD